MNNVGWNIRIEKADIDNQYKVQIIDLDNDIIEHLNETIFHIKLHIKKKLFSSRTKTLGISTLTIAEKNSVKFDAINTMLFSIPSDAEELFREAIECYLDKVIITFTHNLLKTV